MIFVVPCEIAVLAGVAAMCEQMRSMVLMISFVVLDASRAGQCADVGAGVR